MSKAEAKPAPRFGLHAEHVLAEVFAHSPLALAVAEPETLRLSEVNLAWERIFGPRASLLGRRWVELGCWPDGSETQRDDVLRQLMAGAHELDLTVRSVDSATLALCVHSQRLGIAPGDFMLISAADVTEQRASDRQLRSELEKLSAIFKVTPYSITLVDLENEQYVDVNPSFEFVSGMKREEIIGRNSRELALFSDSNERARIIELARRHGCVRGMPSGLRTKRGDVVRGKVAAAVLQLQGRPHLCMIAPDAAEQLETDRAKARFEAQLHQAQRLESLGTLAGGIAHDFNNILSAIVAYTDLIGIDIENRDAVHSHLAELQRAGARATDLVHQILSFSRRQKPHRSALRLAATVAEAAKLLRATLPATIELDVHLDEDTPIVFADPGQVHQLVMNLVINAAHAIGAESGKIAIRLASEDVTLEMSRARPDLQVGRGVRLTVSDTGVGMNEATMARIFEPFFTTKPPGEGRGLGLAVVHGIVRQHDAAISVRSQPGQGTSFELHFPEHPAELADDAPVPDGLRLGNGEHVLLVDDEAPLLASMGKLLQSLNYRVTTCSTPHAALRSFGETQPAFDLVLSDLTMPGMTGVDLARKMLESQPDARIVLMSGFSAEWTPQAVRQLGVRGLIPKPVNAHTLAAVLRATLEEA